MLKVCRDEIMCDELDHAIWMRKISVTKFSLEENSFFSGGKNPEW